MQILRVTRLILPALAAAILYLITPAVAQNAQLLKKANTHENEIIKLVNALSAANVSKNFELLEETLDEDFVGTYDEEVWPKEKLLSNLRTGENVILEEKNDDIKVRFHGSAAVVTGQNTTKEKFQGRDIAGRHRFTQVFVRKDAKWKLAGEHWSRIPGQ